MAPNPLTATLPPEIRTRVYEFVLASPHPIKRQIFEYVAQADHALERRVAPGSEATVEGVSLLLVDRLAYHEALPLLYKVNTFRTCRRHLCADVALNSHTLLNPTHLVHLELSGLSPSKLCGMFGERAEYPKCGICAEPGFGLLYLLASVPHLRTAVIDYGSRCLPRRRRRHVGPRGPFDGFLGKRAFFRFEQAARAPCHAHHNFELTCMGIGEYRVRGGKLKNVDVVFRDARLIDAWSEVTNFFLRARRRAAEDHQVVRERWAKMDTEPMKKLCRLLQRARGFVETRPHSYTNAGLASLPQSSARIWRVGTPVDLLGMGDLKDPGLLERLDLALQEYLDEPAETTVWVEVALP
ncbi:hypothetical protein LTR85_008961 [Meristemomyces frigidus]|nr:hypothetical protein LTR85_008961 [Meristemomyces frigidus]